MDWDAWREWVATRPLSVQALCDRLPPDRLYSLKSSNHKVTIYSYSEDGTVTVNVSGDFNAVIFERQVFGIKPEDLEECDLPPADAILGAVLTDEASIEAVLPLMRAAMGKEPKHG